MKPALRYALLAGATAGLALSPLSPGTSGDVPAAVVLATLIATGVGLARGPETRSRTCASLIALGAAALLLGLLAGAARVRAIDAGAFSAQPGQRLQVRGFVAAVPRRANGTVRVSIDTVAGRLAVEAPEPVPDLSVGAEIEAAGTIRAPDPWLAGYLRLHGISDVLAASRLAPTGASRGGLSGVLDGIRNRAGTALERGMPAAESALARGFVLGQDDRIAPATADEFRRAGLAHLLAVSGQNVVLLAALAIPLLALLGLALRARLIGVVTLIALYVPVAGAAPSIQRAGIMGAATIAATLASRPRSRWYVVLLAELVTLAINPRAPADVGWQLSFAAVVGIILWAPGIARLAGARLDSGRAGWRRALAEAFAVTVAATIATAPLIVHHFEVAQIATLPANLLAAPAVAPVMWLGMLTALAGQLPVIPVEPLNAVCSVLIAYIEQVASWLGGPGSAPAVEPLGWPAVGWIYAGMLAAGALARRAAGRRATLARATRPRGRPRALVVGAAVAACALAAGAWLPLAIGDDGSAPPGLIVSFLDVGQGDAILLDPPRSDPLLVDGGPPGDGIAGQLDRDGVDGLAGVILTHDQSDHAGGLFDVVGNRPVGTMIRGDPAPDLAAAAAAAGVPVQRVAAGDVMRFGGLRLDVLWPPPQAPPADDPNLHCLVLLARWRGFDLLLTGDAEAEAVPIDPGRVDVLKVAHHGSEDAGLSELLDRTQPQLAVTSVGAGNPYGHPSPATLADLDAAGIPVLRTDVDGEVEVRVADGQWSVQAG